MKLEKGGLRLFRLFGIEVYVHWLWAVVALYELQSRRSQYSSQIWNIAEYLSLFAIVLAHEFGQALACRSVGGTADRILLWPLGGVAFVSPPARPGATLWSIAAGPLVNVALLVPTIACAVVFTTKMGFSQNIAHFFTALAVMNGVLLVFNILPIYPLDGGQILQSLLWFVIGRARALMVVAVIGMIGAGALAVYAATQGSVWYGVMAFFGGMRARAGMRAARTMSAMDGVALRERFSCPHCHASPPVGPFWRCPAGHMFDPFETRGACIACSSRFEVTACTTCQQVSPHLAFYPPPHAAPVPESAGVK